MGAQALAQTTTPTSSALGNPTINKNGQVLSHDGSEHASQQKSWRGCVAAYSLFGWYDAERRDW